MRAITALLTLLPLAICALSGCSARGTEPSPAKIGFLESNPVTRHMTAVRNKRYVVLTGSELDPGIRQVQAVEKVAAGLESFGLVS